MMRLQVARLSVAHPPTGISLSKARLDGARSDYVYRIKSL